MLPVRNVSNCFLPIFFEKNKITPIKFCPIRRKEFFIISYNVRDIRSFAELKAEQNFGKVRAEDFSVYSVLGEGSFAPH